MQLTVPIPAMFLAAFLLISALYQLPDTYGELRAALGLTDFQIDHLQRSNASAHPTPQRSQTAGPIYPIPASRITAQWRQLQQQKDAARDVALGVLTPEQRRILATAARVLSKRGAAVRLIRIGALTCGEWPEGCGCFCDGIDADKTFELDDEQRARLKLLKEYDAVKVPREAVISIFNDDQGASLSAFESDLRVAQQAIEIGLIPAPLMGECLCN